MDDIRDTSVLLLHDASLEDIFADKIGQEAITKIAGIAGNTLTENQTEIFTGDLKNVVEAFLNGQFALVSFRSLKKENKALNDVRKHCDALYSSLLKLYEYGAATPKLMNEVKTNPTKYTTPSGVILADLLDDNHNNPFRSIRELISDLSISAEQAIIKNPRADDRRTQYDELKCDVPNALLLKASQRKDIKKRAKLDKEHALRCAVFAFKEVWKKHSTHPFTEGMYYPETKTTLSPTVDAIGVFMQNLDPSVTRQNIVSAIKWLKSNELVKSTFDES